MTRIRVVVTAEDIAQGKHNAVYECPMARALRRIYPRARSLYSFWSPGDGRQTVSYPDEVMQWIAAWEDGARVEPTTFDLEGPPPPSPVPSWWERLRGWA